jgi:acyl CoA:acetate/3-ketoacid CoA transferase beta subunit
MGTKQAENREQTRAEGAAENLDQMVCVAANELKDGDIVFVGIGLPRLACNLARASLARATISAPVTNAGSPIESGMRSGRVPIVPDS